MNDLRSLVALFFPGVAFAIGLVWMRGDPRLLGPPWELFAIALFGAAGTVAGLLDWRLHRSGATVGAPERRAHLLALGLGGGSLFVLMALASVLGARVLLIPVIASAIFTTALICYDEFVHHRRRRCSVYETRLHQTLVFSNGLAFLAWAHWCFVRSPLG